MTEETWQQISDRIDGEYQERLDTEKAECILSGICWECGKPLEGEHYHWCNTGRQIKIQDMVNKYYR